MQNLNRKEDSFNQKLSTIETPLQQVDLKGHTVEELAAVANVSVSAIKKAIEMRQKQLMAEHEEMIQRQRLENELKRDEMIAKQLAMYQQEHQKFLAKSTTQATTIASTKTPATTQKPTSAPPQKNSGKVKPIAIQSKVNS